MHQYRIYTFRDDGHFSASNASNAPTREKQSKKRGNL